MTLQLDAVIIVSPYCPPIQATFHCAPLHPLSIIFALLQLGNYKFAVLPKLNTVLLLARHDTQCVY
jgi:hypothetical protein